jgi:hypothetical protein
MTPSLESPIPPRMGRKKRWHDAMAAKFPEGTFEQIATVLTADEDRTDFVRKAVEREIARRQKAKKKPHRSGASGPSKG